MIKSLQGLRTLAMIAIFLFHAGVLVKGTFPVTFFFILSGFVIYYSFRDKEVNCNIKENFIWVKKRILKLYPIHIITFIMSVFIRWEWIVGLTFTELISKAIVNLLLIQSLFAKDVYSFNSLSWYLSTTFFLYLISVPLASSIKNLKKNSIRCIIILFIIQNLIIFINNSFDINYFLYSSPFFRVFDFTIGMFTAKIFVENSNISKNINFNLCEISLLVIFIFMYLVSIFSPINVGYGFTYYSPVFVSTLYIMAYEKGNLSKFLSNDLLQKVASVSFEFYMVHELVIVFVRNLFNNLNCFWLLKNFIISVPAFIISAIISIILNTFVTRKSFTSLKVVKKRSLNNT